VSALDLLAAGEIGDRSRDLQHSVMSPHGQAEVRQRLIEDATGGRVELAVSSHRS